MHGWVECVPNFSEGQNERLITELEGIVRAVPGVVFLRSDPHRDHNRTLFTFAGPGRAVRRAAFDLIRGAVERIDLTRHIGVHPRMGAVDVVPFVPLGTTTMEAASELARTLGEEVAEKLAVPVFLYEESASRVERRSLADLRRGGFEGHLANGYPAGPPDFGPPRPHPTAGSVAIGARFFLISLNVILDTNDLEVARSVARSIRESSRGLAAVRALGLPLSSQGLVQVAINILDHRLTSLTEVLERLREEAHRLGTSILESELIGLVPRAALAASVWEMLRLPPQRRERVIEDAVENSGAFTFAERLAAATSTPGSGAAAARAILHATSLLRMVAGITLDRLRQKAAPSAGPSARQEAAVGEPVKALQAILGAASELGKRVRRLEVDDEEAFEGFLEAGRRARARNAPPGAAEELAVQARRITEVPLEMIACAREVLAVAERLLASAREHSLSLRAGSDLGGTVELTLAAARIAASNVQINLPHLPAETREELGRQGQGLLGDVERRAGALRDEVAREFLPAPR